MLVCALQGNAQLLLRTTFTGDISAISLGTDFKNPDYGERSNLEECFFYRKQCNRDNLEKTVYNIFSVYKRDSVVGVCPYGVDVDLMSEHFEKNSGNTFRYWNKMRMGCKFLVETNPKYSLPIWSYFNLEIYGSYLHLPHNARGDQTTKARKGSFMLFLMTTPGSFTQLFQTNSSTKFLGYVKCNVSSVWIKAYFRQGQTVGYTGIQAEWETNPKGYSGNKVESSKDTYRGITLFGGPEYQIQLHRISMTLGIIITSRNH